MNVKPGSYYLGDPCYVFKSQDRWIELLESSNYFKGTTEGKLDGYTVYAMGTAHGDGVYEDQFGNEYAVDSGLLGLVPLEICDIECADSAVRLGNVIEIEGGAIIGSNEGVLTLGEYMIDTD